MSEGQSEDITYSELKNQLEKPILYHVTKHLNVGYELTDQDYEDMRQFWSDSSVHLIRAGTGFIDGVFDSVNATKCGSRLVQFNDNFHKLILSTELDAIIYQLASLTALGAFTTYNCYFTVKETITRVGFFVFDYEVLFVRNNWNFLHLVWFN